MIYRSFTINLHQACQFCVPKIFKILAFIRDAVSFNLDDSFTSMKLAPSIKSDSYSSIVITNCGFPSCSFLLFLIFINFHLPEVLNNVQ